MKKTIITIAAVLFSGVCAFAAHNVESSEVKPFERGIEISTSTFIPKGTIGGGVSFSYNDYSLGQGIGDAGYTALMSLIGDLQGSLQSWGVAPWASYFVADNFALGARFDYDRSSFGLGNASISLGDLASFSLNDYYFLKQSYTGAVIARYYIPFADSKRFAMFTEVRALGGYGQSETYQITDGQKFGTYQDIYKFELGLVPGLAVFVTNEVAVEVAVGLLGFNYNKTVQTTNQVDTSVMESSGANFKINPLSLELGLSFYIPTGVNRTKK